MRDKKTYVTERLINEMFKIAGHDITYEDILSRKDNWFLQYSMTEEQHKEWLDWGTDLLVKELQLPKYQAEREMDNYNYQFGLSIKWGK